MECLIDHCIDSFEVFKCLVYKVVKAFFSSSENSNIKALSNSIPVSGLRDLRVLRASRALNLRISNLINLKALRALRATRISKVSKLPIPRFPISKFSVQSVRASNPRALDVKLPITDLPALSALSNSTFSISIP